jgi:serine/threonine-protein kinase
VPTPDQSLTHQILGRYQLLVPVARGGMGQVWLGRLHGARGYRKLVAIKTLLAEEQDIGRLERMLSEEARIAGLIHHPNVVQTIELGEHEGMLYLVMEWVDGESLSFLSHRAAERGGMPLVVAVTLASQVLAGLHAAHELSDESGLLGIVHRDVSPHNVLVTYDGVAKLVDFGIAKATNQVSSTTETGEIKGKFSYMAPEQILGGAIDRRTDLFAAGIVLYLLTTGQHPFKHPNTAGVIHSITSDVPALPPSRVVPTYPARLEAVVMKALAKDPAQRWSSADEMRLALARAMPEAFTDTGRAALRDFMEHSVGDRKQARREAIRRAQVAADVHDLQSGTRPALQESSQSASSLRAIAVSQPAGPDAPEADSGDTEAPSTRKVRRPVKWMLLSAALGACALVLAIAAQQGPRTHSPASAGFGSELSNSGARDASPAPPASAPPSAAPPELVPAPRVSAAPLAASEPATKPAAPRAAKKPGRPAPATAPAATPSAPAASRDDLIPPDYATP